jgi:hypothetical protein
MRVVRRAEVKQGARTDLVQLQGSSTFGAGARPLVVAQGKQRPTPMAKTERGKRKCPTKNQSRSRS